MLSIQKLQRVKYQKLNTYIRWQSLNPSVQKFYYFPFTPTLLLNFHTKQLFFANEKKSLTSVEFKLLFFFLKNSGICLNRKIIISNVWGFDVQREVDTRLVDVNIYRLRRKLCTKNTGFPYIRTIRGKGYSFHPQTLWVPTI